MDEVIGLCFLFVCYTNMPELQAHCFLHTVLGVLVQTKRRQHLLFVGRMKVSVWGLASQSMCFWFSCYTQAESINSSYCVWESSRRWGGGWLWGESPDHHHRGFVFLFMCCSSYSVWNKWEQAVRFYCYWKGNILQSGQSIQAQNAYVIPATML